MRVTRGRDGFRGLRYDRTDADIAEEQQRPGRHLSKQTSSDGTDERQYRFRAPSDRNGATPHRPWRTLGDIAVSPPTCTRPGFPEIVTSFRTSGASVQLSLTACLVGLAVGQVVLGPVSDAMGRRRLLLVGSGTFTVLSLVCALAPSIAVFDIARLLQGIAGSAGLVIGRAVISDRFTGTRAARQLSTLSVIGMTAPVLPPVVGGLILGVGSWRLVFVALAVTGLLLLTAVWAWLPESLPAERLRTGGLPAVFVAMGGLLRRRELIGYLLVMGCGLAALFAYITGSPFVLQNTYGLSPTDCSLVFAANAVGTVVAGGIFGRLAGRVRLNSLLVTGVLITVTCVITLMFLLAIGISTLPTTWAPACSG
ncbi:multidrug effflux MFS transporter [Streptomyces decoyicus]